MSDVLALDRVSAGYGEAIVISTYRLRLREGAALAVLGRNGTGKTTLLNTIIGVTRQRGGAITPRRQGSDILPAGGARACRHWAGCRRSATSSSR